MAYELPIAAVLIADSNMVAIAMHISGRLLIEDLSLEKSQVRN